MLNGTTVVNDDRIPPDGQESAALLKNAENNGNSCPIVGCTGLNNVAVVPANQTTTVSSSTFGTPGTNGTLKRINVVSS